MTDTADQKQNNLSAPQVKSPKPPQDGEYLRRLESAYKGEIKCVVAYIKTAGLVPFSDFKPNITKEYRAWFSRNMKRKPPSPLYVYQRDDKFVVSDDYSSYYLLLAKKHESALCLVMGDTSGPMVVEASEEFDLPKPKSSRKVSKK